MSPPLKKPTPRPMRAMAEAQLARHPVAEADARLAPELLHELQVHQVEMEMQNEALREALAALEASRDRYADLYEFAPVGYLALDSNGMIGAVNLTGAKLLATERVKLLNHRFTALVVPHDQNHWMQHFLGVKLQGTPDSVELVMRRGDGTVFPARLDLVWHESDAGMPAMRVALTDMSARTALKQHDQIFRAVFERSPIGIGIAGADRRYRMVNPAMCRMLGYTEAELLGKQFTEITHPDDVKLNVWNLEGLVAGEASHFSMEKRYIRKDGATVWVSLNAVAVNRGPGGEMYTVGLVEDITARRREAAEKLASAQKQRDTLVREVHHRIKNNLQSVAGLLQRELGKFAAINPRLETAISQVNAIAVVHGLQSTDPSEAIQLCDSVRSICKTVSDLAQRPVQFIIENEQTSFRAVEIDSNEAVPLALVLNELILNAVKHSPPHSPAPSVTLRTDGSTARLLIRNSVAKPPDFDLDAGRGLGTGLSLVRSLLPGKGARLTYELSRHEVMLTHLRLSAPVVTKSSRPPKNAGP
jgi:PAS domain S-box-containing protein